MKAIKKSICTLVAAVGLVGAALGVSAPASAQGIYVGVGPGWHHGWDRDRDWRYRHHWRAEYGGGCRVVVRRFWRHGHMVVVRRRTCY